MSYKKAFFLLLTCNLAILIMGAWGLTHNRLYERIWKKFTQAPYAPNWQNEVDKHRQLYTDTMTIVMLGNSITYEGNWSELLDRADVANRGIPGDVTHGMLARLGSVLQLQPKLVFLEAGINDILSGYPLEKTKQNYQALIDALLKNGIQPVVSLTFYTRYVPEENRRVDELNQFLAAYCGQHQVPVIDLGSAFNENGRLRKHITHDGVHLSPDGYRLWAAEVKKVLGQLGY